MARIPTKLWTLEGALELVRKVATEMAAVGWGVALAGSVLREGSSRNDLDIVVYPYTTADCDQATPRAVLARLGFSLRVDVDEVHRAWRKRGSHDTKTVLVYNYEGKKVDVFFLQ